MTTRRKTTLPAFIPVPRKCQRYDGWTEERQRGFIEALADLGSVRAAANSVGMTPESAYMLRRQPGAETFRKAWAAALDLGVERIEDVAMERALNGVEVPVYSYGKLVGTRRVYNDRLLMFILRNRSPGRFTEGRPKALNAVDKQQVERLKKQWRKEWEAEREAKAPSPSEISASLQHKINNLRAQVELTMSPRTRELYEAWRAAQEEDEEATRQRAPAGGEDLAENDE